MLYNLEKARAMGVGPSGFIEEGSVGTMGSGDTALFRAVGRDMEGSLRGEME